MAAKTDNGRKGESGAQTTKIVSPDKRPFWASAGPDGNINNGDDNIYSFEN